MAGYQEISETRAKYVKDILYLLYYLFYPLKSWLFEQKNNNEDIMRFQIKIDEQTHSMKISQLADDTTLCFFLTPKTIYLLL